MYMKLCFTESVNNTMASDSKLSRFFQVTASIPILTRGITASPRTCTCRLRKDDSSFQRVRRRRCLSSKNKRHNKSSSTKPRSNISSTPSVVWKRVLTSQNVREDSECTCTRDSTRCPTVTERYCLALRSHATTRQSLRRPASSFRP